MLRRWLRHLFPRPRPVLALPGPLTRARLELDAVDVEGRVATDDDGVFFATSAPIARGVRGHLRRAGSDEHIPVRVLRQRPAAPGRPAGLRLAFE